MIILTINKNIETSFILLNETDLSITKIPFVKEFNSSFIDPFDNEEYPNNPYGVTNDKDNIYISNRKNIASFDIKTFEFKKIISTTGIDNLSKIQYYNGYIFRCDSKVNCISKINVETLDETYIDVIQGNVIPELYNSSFNVEKNVIGNKCSFFVNNNNLHLWCKKYYNIIKDDSISRLELYKTAMNSTPDVSLNNNNFNYNKNQSLRWNMLIVENTGVTRADSFDYYFDPDKKLGILNDEIYNPPDIIENSLDNEILNKKSSDFGNEVVFNIETNSVQSINKLYGTINSGLIVINGITWTLCKEHCQLLKCHGNYLSRYKLENTDRYLLSSITYKNNNIYIFAFPIDILKGEIYLTHIINEEGNIEYVDDNPSDADLIKNLEKYGKSFNFDPETRLPIEIKLNEDYIPPKHYKEQYINRPFLPSLMLIFNIDTEQIERKILHDDIFNNSYVNCADFL